MASPSSSSSAPTPSSSNNDQSFTTMATKDVEAIGAHCQYTYCNQLDFLPFRCESCKGTYCLDHRTETAHKCAHAGEWAARRKTAAGNNASLLPSPSSSISGGGKPTLLTATQCSHPQCRTYINTLNSVGVACPTCHRHYCLKHRLREEHLCNTLIPLGARPSAANDAPALRNLDKARSALGRLRVWGKEKQAALAQSPTFKPANSKPSTAASRIVALNALKKDSKGDAKIPAEQRVYLHVEAEASTTTTKLPQGKFWYGKDWSVGRVLDAAARALQVENMNNRGGGEGERLRVYHVEGGRVLDFGEKVGDVFADGNRVVLLRGIGPVVRDLDKQ